MEIKRTAVSLNIRIWRWWFYFQIRSPFKLHSVLAEPFKYGELSFEYCTRSLRYRSVRIPFEFIQDCMCEGIRTTFRVENNMIVIEKLERVKEWPTNV